MYRPLPSTHPDYPVLAPIVATLQARAGGELQLRNGFCQLLRTAFDEVIDAPRTNRFTLREIEKTEKTYVGTKVEILFRNFFGLPKGRILDLDVNGTEVDIKNTVGSNWSIPPENVERPALLIRSNETSARCDLGLAVLHNEYLNPGANRDGKRGLSRTGADNTWWILVQQPYPPNFFEILSPADRTAIMSAGAGTARIAELFRRVQGQPISRMQIQALAQQKDYMKRIRRNGGARDRLAPEGIAILWGSKDRDLIVSLGLGDVTEDEFISYKPTDPNHIHRLRIADHID